MSRVNQPVLQLLPAGARPVGPSAGLLEGPEGGVVFVFGLATFSYASADLAGRRLAAVQLVTTKIASVGEVASAFGVNEATLWRWKRAFGAGGVLGLVTERPGPRRPSKLTKSVAARIVKLAATGLTLQQIAVATGVSTATVRVALGRVTPRDQAPVEDDVDEPEDDAGDAELIVLAAPVPRTADRVAARFGDLVEAPVVITEGAQLPLAVLWLTFPAFELPGLLPVAGELSPPLRKGLYGLRATLLMGVFLALLREPRAEAATRIRPADLGRLLGLDRAPEVKTLRRKLTELAGCRRGAALQAAPARAHDAARPEALGFLHVDGHVRVYAGTRNLPKTHIARMHLAGHATAETWVADADADPVLVVTAPPAASLASELVRLLPELRAVVGPDRRATVVFDRGGWSATTFAAIGAAGFDLLTYRKGPFDRLPDTAFTAHTGTDPDGQVHNYRLAETTVELPLPNRAGATVGLRQVHRQAVDGTQIPVLTSRTDLPAAEVCWRLAARWRQENYFKYARAHFALDALDSYADTPDDPTRPVPNPAKAAAKTAVETARASVHDAETTLSDAIDDAAGRARRPGSGARATVDPAAGTALSGARDELAHAADTSRATPGHLPLHQVRPDARLLDEDRKLLTHAIGDGRLPVSYTHL